MLRTTNYLSISIPAIICFALALVSFPSLAQAGIDSNTEFSIDFTNADQASVKATWARPEEVKLSAKGLRWDIEDHSGSIDFWLQSEPIAIGESWRPPQSASVTTSLDYSGKPGNIFVRHSCDRKHWSTWQLLTPGERETIHSNLDKKDLTCWGSIQIPLRETAPYNELRMKYARRGDVAWRSDEQALVEELVAEDPTFFEKSTPFIGYVQVLYETQLKATDSIQSLDINIAWSIGGRHLPPEEDLPSYRERFKKPWQFKAKED
ncbi:MAG: hypothetical protein R3C11_22525 [Planctomycetaceae bacterium]